MSGVEPEAAGAGAPLRLLAGEGECDQRLDRALAALLGMPRAQVQRWIEDGCVRVNEKAPRASQKLRLGDAIVVEPPEPTEAHARPEPIPLAILHEDAACIVVDKPAGLVTHPAPGHPGGTLVNALLHHCGDLSGIGGVLRPGIVHRLDRGTSGVMVVAKSDAAHASLAAQFQDHTVERIYLAFVRGVPGADAGRIDRPIGRHPRDRKRMSVVTRHGREAHTAWRVRRRYPASRASLLEVRPETGRTHQIRVHLSSSGAPIIGDPVYGRGRRFRGAALSRPALHAAVLGFDHPESGERLRFESPLPDDLRALQAALEEAEPA